MAIEAQQTGTRTTALDLELARRYRRRGMAEFEPWRHEWPTTVERVVSFTRADGSESTLTVFRNDRLLARIQRRGELVPVGEPRRRGDLGTPNNSAGPPRNPL